MNGSIPDITLKKDDSTISLISRGNRPGQLEKMLEELEHKMEPLKGLNTFTSADGMLNIDVFTFQTHKEPLATEIPSSLLEYTDDLQSGKFCNGSNLLEKSHASPAPYFEKQALEAYIRKCEQSYVLSSSPRRFCKQLEMYQNVVAMGTDDVAIDIEPNWNNSNCSMITLALPNILQIPVLKKLARYLLYWNLRKQ